VVLNAWLLKALTRTLYKMYDVVINIRYRLDLFNIRHSMCFQPVYPRDLFLLQPVLVWQQRAVGNQSIIIGLTNIHFINVHQKPVRHVPEVQF